MGDEFKAPLRMWKIMDQSKQYLNNEQYTQHGGCPPLLASSGNFLFRNLYF